MRATQKFLDRLRIRSIQLALGLSGALLGILILEGAARLLPPPSNYPGFDNHGDIFQCSPTVGWSGKPNYQGLLTREEYSHPIRFNSEGMYDTEHIFEKNDHTFRILWVGDSYAQAMQVGEPQTAHQQLENLLNERLGGPGQSFEVVNTGVMGWGVGQELVYYREQGRLYQPDLVLQLFFMGNDVNDNLPGHALTVDGFNCFAPYFPVCQGALDPEPWVYIPGLDSAWGSCSPAHKLLASGLGVIRYHSYLFARLEPLLLSWKSRRTYGQEFGLPFAALYTPQESEEVRYGWQVSEALLAQFNREVKADGAKFAVAIVAPREVIWLSQLNPGQLQSFYQSDPAFINAKIEQPNRRLINFLQSEQIPELDLQPPMIDYITQTGVQLYLPTDRHWTVEGNRLAAELILRWLVENNLVSQSLISDR